MAIFFDATEKREGTRLPEAVISAGQSVIGLEAATGADLLLSTLTTPRLPEKLTDSKLHTLALTKHLDAGMLVQRKSGRDLTGSIPELANIIRRMRASGCPLCWLLVAGELTCQHGNCYVDGKDSGYSYQAVMGALEWWKLRGGYVSIVDNDRRIPQWVDGWVQRLKELESEPVRQIVPRVPTQVLTGPNWKSVLCNLPSIGPDTAERIATSCGSLADSLVFLSNPDNAGLIENVGKGRINAVRRILGLNENTVLQFGTPEGETE